ncbi:hypothetical protein [Streptacidiphilus sp. MAP12-20]|uniref:hypothetical protein n=1 Tax=Streptacidiphilus sp. MAP12-20 TaxID=3156299 RepID=UPI0035164512
MLRLTDGRTARPVSLPPDGRRLVRLRALPTLQSGAMGIDDVRVMVVADVLRRALEVSRVVVVHAMGLPPTVPRELARGLERHLTAFNVHPPIAEDDGRADVEVVPTGGAKGDANGDAGARVEVARVRSLLTAPLPGGTPGDAPEADPLALRLALLAHPYREPVELTPDAVAEAALSLASWRAQVAGWARSSSAPVSESLQAEARAALDADLDTPSLLALLDLIGTTADLPDGARFEALVWMDRLLGLDLARDLGSG